MQSPRKSIRCLSQHHNLGAYLSCRIIQEYVKLLLHKIQMEKILYEADQVRKVDVYGYFKVSLEHNPTVPQSVCCSNEVHFHLNGCVNKQNMCTCGPGNTCLI
jgi:hypothetical protein